eukprot:6919876-Prorocentrum_lima.AAC.1
MARNPRTSLSSCGQGRNAVFNDHCGVRSIHLCQAALTFAAHNCAVRVLRREVAREERLHQ